MTTNASAPSRDTGKRLLRRHTPIAWIDAGLKLIALAILLLVGWANADAGQNPVRTPTDRIALHPSTQAKAPAPAMRGAT